MWSTNTNTVLHHHAHWYFCNVVLFWWRYIEVILSPLLFASGFLVRKISPLNKIMFFFKNENKVFLSWIINPFKLYFFFKEQHLNFYFFKLTKLAPAWESSANVIYHHVLVTAWIFLFLIYLLYVRFEMHDFELGFFLQRGAAMFFSGKGSEPFFFSHLRLFAHICLCTCSRIDKWECVLCMRRTSVLM